MTRFLVVLGLVLLVAGLLWPYLSQIGLGRLPGDIVIQRENVTFYFPLVTCLLLSVLFSVVLWVVNRRNGERVIAPNVGRRAPFFRERLRVYASMPARPSGRPACHAGARPRFRCHGAGIGRRGFLPRARHSGGFC
jgi:Protein of unknown function (DUF2905)